MHTGALVAGLAIATSLGAASAHAQDVVVMRRSIATPRAPVPTPSPSTTPITYAPIIGEYGEYTTDCGSATRSRVNSCIRSTDGASVDPPTWCGIPGIEQDPTTPVEMTSACTYTPTYGPFGECTRVDATSTGRRSASLTACRRSDGKDVTADNASMGEPHCALTLGTDCALEPYSTLVNGDFSTNAGWALSFAARYQSISGNRRLSCPLTTSGSSLYCRADQTITVTPNEGYVLAAEITGAIGVNNAYVQVQDDVSGEPLGLINGRTGQSQASFTTRSDRLRITIYASGDSRYEANVVFDNIRFVN